VGSKKKAKKAASGGGGGGGGLDGILGSIMGGANPMAMAEVATTSITGIVSALAIVLALFLVSTVFVIPRGYRIFWLLLVSLTGLFLGAFRLYQEWINTAAAEDSDKYRSMAQGLLTALTVIFTIVFVSILFVMMWKIGVVAKRKSDLIDGMVPNGAHTNVSAPLSQTEPVKARKRSRGPELGRRDMYM
jgi:hypothetical protein